MKLDIDLVRELLLFLESRNDHHSIKYTEIKIDGFDSLQVGYHLNRMYEAGFINGEVIRSQSTHERIIEVISFDLSWRGNQFINTIRDPEVWRKTKDGAHKIGGASVEFLWEIAKAYGKHLAKQKLGIDVP